MWNQHQLFAVHCFIQNPWGETCMPLWVNSAFGRLKYFVNIGSARCASCTVLSSALFTPVDDVVAKRNPWASTSWPSTGCNPCYWLDLVWFVGMSLYLGMLLDSAPATILSLSGWYTIFGRIDWNNPSRIHLIWDKDKTRWSIITVTPPGQPSRLCRH